LSVLNWAENRRPDEVAPDVLKTWMATHDEPEPSPAAQVKAVIHRQGEDGITREDLRVFFDDAALAGFSDKDVVNGDEGAKLDRVLRALFHAKEIDSEWDQDEHPDDAERIYTAGRAALAFDVDKMLDAQPNLGTWSGMAEEEIVWIDLAAPESEDGQNAELVDLVLRFVKERDRPTTKLDIMTRFGSWALDEVKDAIDHLYEKGDLQEGNDGFSPKAGDDAEKGGE
jgi:hypothetical protein